jgi:hypothetical protein
MRRLRNIAHRSNNTALPFDPDLTSDAYHYQLVVLKVAIWGLRQEKNVARPK